jgi:hypothetical protein
MDSINACQVLTSPSCSQQKFALPQMPTHIVDAEVPVNFRLRIGETGENKFGSGGGIQIEAFDKFNNPNNPIKFANPRELK